jgi:hypothetical protein
MVTASGYYDQGYPDLSGASMVRWISPFQYGDASKVGAGGSGFFGDAQTDFWVVASARPQAQTGPPMQSIIRFGGASWSRRNQRQRSISRVAGSPLPAVQQLLFGDQRRPMRPTGPDSAQPLNQVALLVWPQLHVDPVGAASFFAGL